MTTVLCAILTYLSAWIIVGFKIRHKGVMNYPDVGAVLFGKWGRIILAWGLTAKVNYIGRGHKLLALRIGHGSMLTGSTFHPPEDHWRRCIALSCRTAGSDEYDESRYLSRVVGTYCGLCLCPGTYTAMLANPSLFVPISSAHFRILDVPSPDLGSADHHGLFICDLYPGLVIVVAVQSSSRLIQDGKPIVWRTFPEIPTLTNVIGAVTNIIFSFASCTAAMSFSSEMRRPADFRKSSVIVNIICVLASTVIGAVIYAYGRQVLAPFPVSTG